MLVDKKGNIMNILINALKGVGIICGTAAIAMMGIFSADYIVLLDEVYRARHGDEEAILSMEERYAFLDGIRRSGNTKEKIILIKEYIKDV